MRRISENFTAKEVACNCGDCNRSTADVELVWLLEYIRTVYGLPVIIHSWFRCWAHNNRKVTEYSSYGVPGAGSSDGSWHLIGGAADFSIPDTAHFSGIEPVKIRNMLRKRFPDRYGIGVYDWGVHIDIGPRKDWDVRTKGLIA